ncbi:MAG TPA: methyltransferase domain-containing protein [Planctomycetota bacterium]|nr:methyltransferase domain-containing protein [Planctomycetota bacterium]
MGSDNPIAFIKQSIRDFRTTGAVAPSSAFLARGIAKNLPAEVPENFRVLEVGAGTGSITTELARHMSGRGYLELFEISPDFCSVLRQRVAVEKCFEQMRSRISIHEGDVRSLKKQHHYDAIVSGLPFNCFQPDEVRGFIEHFRYLLKPGGGLIWFEYVAIRQLQSPFVGKARREQLKGVGAVTGSFIREHQYRQQIVPLNLPPARIRHLRFG